MASADHHLSPSDAVVALRTFPRRYRAALLPMDDVEHEARALTIGPAGVSATDLAADSVRTLVVCERALHDIRVTDAPVLHPAVVDRSQRHWDAAVRESPAAVLAQLDDVTRSLADTVESIPTKDWTRTATCAGTTVDALAVVREAVDTAVTNLRSIEALLTALR